MTDTQTSPALQRTPIDPWPWSLAVGYHQAEILTGARRQMICAGQTSVDGEGRPQHPGDMRAQIMLSLDNLQTVLETGGMDLGNVIQLRIYATDVDVAMRSFDLLGARFGPTGNAPPMTVLGVSRLALPDLLFEVEAIAVD